MNGAMETASYQRLLVPCDGSPTSQAGLDAALKLAQQCSARVCIVHVIDELLAATGFESGSVYLHDVLDGLRRSGAELLEGLRAHAAGSGVTLEAKLMETGGRPIAERIAEQARDWRADLIVIGSHGRSGASRLLMGSTAEQILRRSPVPVLIVKPPAPASGR